MLISGITFTILYVHILLFLLRTFKGCFTLGEAGVASQVIIIIIYSFFVNTFNLINGGMFLRSNIQISTVIIQVSQIL